MADRDELILDVIIMTPGITGAEISRAFELQSRCARWFGPDSVITALFGGYSLGSIYVSLARLEDSKKICGQWGERTPHGHRRRHYYPVVGTVGASA